MKKIRGFKRYYRNLKRKIDEFHLDLSEDSWYDMWHKHIDWDGYSNLSLKHRKQHIKLLIQLFKNIINQVGGYSGMYQHDAAIISNR